MVAAVALLAVSAFFGATTVNPEADTLPALLAAYAVAALLGGSALLAGAVVLARELEVGGSTRSVGRLGLGAVGLFAFAATLTSVALTAVISPTTMIVGTVGVSIGVGSPMTLRLAYAAGAAGLLAAVLVAVGAMRSL